MRDKKYNGIPENILADVMQIVENENFSDLAKVAKLYDLETCFVFKEMIAQLVERPNSFVKRDFLKMK